MFLIKAIVKSILLIVFLLNARSAYKAYEAGADIQMWISTFFAGMAALFLIF